MTRRLALLYRLPLVLFGLAACGMPPWQSDDPGLDAGAFDGATGAFDGAAAAPDGGDPGDRVFTCGGRPCTCDDPVPEPADWAPELDLTRPTSIAEIARFLYETPNEVQRNVTAVLDDARVAVVRGEVRGTDGAPFLGARITLVDHPELGCTQSRADGAFDLAVPGGASYRVRIVAPGYLPIERRVYAPVREFAWVDDAALTALDPSATTVELSTLTSVTAARGSEVTDADGTRRGVLLFSPGTTATMRLPDGSRAPLDRLTVRVTEYTVGPEGVAAMPAELPPGTGYTYAAELSVDEAQVAGATSVEFSQPVPFYVDNFLGFPVGAAAPAGFFDRTDGVWKPYESGIVLSVLGVDAGLARLDLNGDGAAATDAELMALGITTEERRTLATLYGARAGESFWRVALPHFTPLDINWPVDPPCVGEAGCLPDVDGPESAGPPPEDDPCERSGSIIECETRVLGEELPISGTPHFLAYRSDRAEGYDSTRAVDIPLLGATVPEGLLRVNVRVAIAGQRITRVVAPAPNASVRVPWDGRDGYGRRVNGRQTADIAVEYVYRAWFLDAERVAVFGAPPWGEVTAWPEQSRQATTISFFKRDTVVVSGFRAAPLGEGGWTISARHFYDAERGVLHRGDGTDRRVAGTGLSYQLRVAPGEDRIESCTDSGCSASTLPAGPMVDPQAIRVGPDGLVYALDYEPSNPSGPLTLRRYTAAGGPLETLAGGGATDLADGVPALDLPAIEAFDVSADGRIFVVAGGRLGVIRPDGTVRHLAGGGAAAAAEGADAREADLAVGSVAVDDRGLAYLFDANSQSVWRVGSDRTLLRVTGAGTAAPADGVRAIDASVEALALDVDAQRRLVIYADLRPSDSVFFRLGADGTLHRIAGAPSGGARRVDGVAARAADLSWVDDFALRPDGQLGFVRNAVLYEVGDEGVIRAVTDDRADTFEPGAPHPDGALVQSAALRPVHVAADDEGWVIASLGNGGDSDYGGANAYHVVPVSAGPTAAGETLLPSADGRMLYSFLDGRHRRTINAVTGFTVHELEYDAASRLTAIVDQVGARTVVDRDADGRITAVTSPDGHRTELVTDAGGDLVEARYPGSRSVRMTYASGGLLTSFTRPGGGTSTFSYTPEGLLERDVGPAGRTLELIDSGYGVVTARTGAGVEATYGTSGLEGSVTSRELTDSAGLTASAVAQGNASQLTAPDGSSVQVEMGSGPNFGALAPVVRRMSATTPGGRAIDVSMAREVEVDPALAPIPRTWSETTTVNGRSTTSRWDRASRTFTQTTEGGRETRTTLDARGLIASVQAGGFADTRFEYDARGRVVRVTRGSGADARVTELTYDARGNLASVRDPLGRVSSYTYDAADRPTATTHPGGAVSRTEYDADSNITAVVPPGRMSHVFDYGADSLPSGYTLPSGDAATYTRDVDRRVSGFTRSDGETIEYLRDAAGRVTRIRTARGDYTMSYDPADGELVDLTTPDGDALSVTRDGQLPLSMRWTGAVEGVVSWEWAGDGRLERELVNGAHAIDYAYDADLAPRRIGALEIVRDAPSGFVIGSELDQVATAERYSAFGERERYDATFGRRRDLVFSYELTHDRLGRTTQRVETVDGLTTTWAYEYGPAGYLRRVLRDGAVFARYDYDDNGNRLGADYPLEGTSFSAEYDINDDLLRYGSATYLFDGEGQLVRRTDGAAVTEYAYDVVGALRRVALPDGRVITYAVDPMGRRISRRVDGALQQRWLYSGPGHIVAELDASGAVRSRFVYGTQDHVPDYVERRDASGALRRYRLLTDTNGSVRRVVDASSGAVAQAIDYDAFGRVLRDTNPGFTPFGFAGGHYDPATGLVRFGARDYDPETGRWTAPDPIGFAGGDTNPYVYTFNRPLDLIDPEGTLPHLVACGLAGAAEGAATEVIWQLIETRGRFGCISWRRVAIAALTDGALGAATCGVGNMMRRARPRAPRPRGPRRRPCAASFAAGTPVQTPDGPRPIESIREGDLVLAFDEATGELTTRTAGRRSIRPGQPLVSVATDRDAAPLRVTPNHPMLTDRGWVDAGALRLGDRLLTQDGSARVTELSTELGADVYNFEVDGEHTYFAGDLAALTHNPNCRLQRIAGERGNRYLEEVGRGNRTEALEYMRRGGNELGVTAQSRNHARSLARERARELGPGYEVIHDGGHDLGNGRMGRDHFHVQGPNGEHIGHYFY